MEGDNVEKAFVQYYIHLLGTERNMQGHICQDIIDKGPVLSEEQHDLVMRPVTGEEIKLAIFSIPGDKSPGPDGFGTHFFKEA